MAVTGSNPFEFTDLNGAQVSIPLSGLKVDSGNITVDANKWPPFADYPEKLKTLLAAYLKELNAGKLVQLVPPPKPAVVFTAADLGTAGNNIAIEIDTTPAADGDPEKTGIKVTVSETETYPGLELATIADVLGTELVAGTTPGLALVLSASVDPTRLPVAQVDVPFPDGADGAKTELNVLDAAGDVVFTLQARKAGTDAKFTKATISNVNEVDKTFTLTLTWKNSVTAAKLPSLEADLAPLAYEITVSPPPDGPFAVPGKTANPVNLSGGAADKAATVVLMGV